MWFHKSNLLWFEINEQNKMFDINNNLMRAIFERFLMSYEC